MTTRTRYFVIVSLLVLGVGLGSGLVAYYVGFQAKADGAAGGPKELAYVPRDASVIAFANVQEIMTSDLRQKIHRGLPMQENGQRELQDKTGINLETDVDRVVACARAQSGEQGMSGAGMVLARGRFDEVKIEALMREHGAQVQDYNGSRVIVADVTHRDADATTDPTTPTTPERVHRPAGSFSLSFIEPGLAAFGSTDMIKAAIDLHKSGSSSQTGPQSATLNEELMTRVRSMDDGNAWVVGRFDVLRSQAHLPDEVSSRIPAITWVTAKAHINGGIRGTLTADTRDVEAANNLRDVIRGFLALVKLQAGGRPELQAMAQSIELGGTGQTVSISFTVPGEVFDLIGALSQGKKAAN
jgi:hypothetical protein